MDSGSGGRNTGVLLELADSRDSSEEEIPGEEDKDRDIRCDRLDARADTASVDQSQDGACNEGLLQMHELRELLDELQAHRDFDARSSSAASALTTAPARAPEAGARCSSDCAEAREMPPATGAWPGAPSATASPFDSPAASSSATARAAGSSLSSANHSVELPEESLAQQQDLIKQLVMAVKDAALLALVVVVARASALQIDPEIRDVRDETASARGATRRDCNSLASACSSGVN